VWLKLTWQELECTVIGAAVRTALIENLDLLTATVWGCQKCYTVAELNKSVSQDGARGTRERERERDRQTGRENVFLMFRRKVLRYGISWENSEGHHKIIFGGVRSIKMRKCLMSREHC